MKLAPVLALCLVFWYSLVLLARCVITAHVEYQDRSLQVRGDK
jgi:hypothetical protein